MRIALRNQIIYCIYSFKICNRVVHFKIQINSVSLRKARSPGSSMSGPSFILFEPDFLAHTAETSLPSFMQKRVIARLRGEYMAPIDMPLMRRLLADIHKRCIFLDTRRNSPSVDVLDDKKISNYLLRAAYKEEDKREVKEEYTEELIEELGCKEEVNRIITDVVIDKKIVESCLSENFGM